MHTGIHFWSDDIINWQPHLPSICICLKNIYIYILDIAKIYHKQLKYFKIIDYLDRCQYMDFHLMDIPTNLFNNIQVINDVLILDKLSFLLKFVFFHLKAYK